MQGIETQPGWPSTLTKSDIRIPEVVPPSPILEAEQDHEVSGFLEELGIDFSSCSGYLKPTSPFVLHGDSDNSEVGCVVEQPLRRSPRRRGLLVGVKYNSHETILEGAHDDVEDMKEFLVDCCGWDEEVILVLKDDGSSNQQPTRDAIIAEMYNLVRDACAGDQLFFQFSGHGGQIPDTSGDEDDGFDEVIYSCDKYPIVDDVMHEILVKPLPAGCRLTAIFDCCSSGTGLDLPVTFLSSISQKQTALLTSPHTVSDETGGGAMSPGIAASPSLRNGPFPFQHLHQPPSPNEASFPQPSLPTSPWRHTEGDVILWSSCQDSELSYEVLASKDYRMKGAMTHAFIECLKAQKQQTYRQLLDSLHEMLLLWGCPQKPMMSSAHHINMHDIFSL